VNRKEADSFATLLPIYKSTPHRSPQHCKADVITVETAHSVHSS